MKLLKRIFAGVVVVAMVGISGFILWASTPLRPAPEAFSALESDSQVIVTEDELITFRPAGSEPTTAFVFYPGGRVDARAYAAPLREIAKQGYLVILVPVRLNLAMLDLNAADRAVAASSSIQHWVIGGHSVGGVAAASYASANPVDGLVLWASYPGSDSLKESDLKVLSIYGTQDISSVDVFESSRALLPVDAEFVSIQGGNHSQFGDYGLQAGDKPAKIARLDQQAQVVKATSRFLKEISQ
ncbi:MAG TPA: alpha/beta hydrolase [Anaerolineales bacterium]|nr:alpha/beta hydrolase [Anaerolineales bacterium]